MSSKPPRYVQCRLTKDNGDGSESTTTTWIPAPFACVGFVLRLRRGGEWVDGWRVVETHGMVAEVPDPRKAIREHRDRTGDETKKRKRPGFRL